MLSSDQLVKEISATITKSKVVKLRAILEKQQFALPDLIDLTFHPDKNIAFRAAWILENLFLEKPLSYLNDLVYLLARVGDVSNPSCKRHYAKIVMHVTSPKAPSGIQQKLLTVNLQPVVEQLFDWIIDPKVLIAVKVFSLEALFNMRQRYPWIAEELAGQIRFLMRNGTAAIQSRGKKLLGQLP